jgi:hypothetical protein
MSCISYLALSSGNTYAYVATVSPMPKGMKCPPAINPPFIWDYEENFDEGILANMHEFFQEKIKSSAEYKAKYEMQDIQDAPMPTAKDDPGEPEQNDLPF